MRERGVWTRDPLLMGAGARYAAVPGIAERRWSDATNGRGSGLQGGGRGFESLSAHRATPGSIVCPPFLVWYNVDCDKKYILPVRWLQAVFVCSTHSFNTLLLLTGDVLLWLKQPPLQMLV